MEIQAEKELIELLPSDLRDDFKCLVVSSEIDSEVKRFIKGADTIAAYLKCQEELKAGNMEFSKAAEDIAVRLKNFNMPEVNTFLALFAPSYKLTLDELLNGNDKVRSLPINQSGS